MRIQTNLGTYLKLAYFFFENYVDLKGIYCITVLKDSKFYYLSLHNII